MKDEEKTDPKTAIISEISESAMRIVNRADEIARLVELGKWAEEYGIPALKTADEGACSCCDSNENVKAHCDKALAALPKV